MDERTFARKPRSLLNIDRWKATEFRQFLLYTGKIALKGILNSDLFDHFMTFSVAISILVSPQLAMQQWMYAHELLKYFVRQGRNLYGVEFLVYKRSFITTFSRTSEAFRMFGYMQGISIRKLFTSIKKNGSIWKKSHCSNN